MDDAERRGWLPVLPSSLPCQGAGASRAVFVPPCSRPARPASLLPDGRAQQMASPGRIFHTPPLLGAPETAFDPERCPWEGFCGGVPVKAGQRGVTLPCWCHGHPCPHPAPAPVLPAAHVPAQKGSLQLAALHCPGLKIVTGIINNLAQNTTLRLFFILSVLLVGMNALTSVLCLVYGSVKERNRNNAAHPAPSFT